MENFVENIRKEIVDTDDWFTIGYKMVQYLIDHKHLNDERFTDFMDDLQNEDDRFLFLVLMKNLVAQVNNGGFYQYFDNGYANYDKSTDEALDAHEDLIRLYKKYVPKTEKTEKLLKILNNFIRDVGKECCESCEGDGNIHEEETCVQCNGNGYLEEDGEEIECDACYGMGYVEEDHCCMDCGGSGESSYCVYQGNDDDKFYNLFDEEMEKIFKDMILNWLDHWNDDCKLNQFEDKKNESVSISKPKLKLVGTDGNAFAVIGALMDCLRRNGFTAEQREAIRKEATSSNYDNVLATACKYCDVY